MSDLRDTRDGEPTGGSTGEPTGGPTGGATGGATDEELVAAFPNEQLTRDDAPQYRGRLRRQLLVNRCGACGTWHQPPRPICPTCWSSDVVATEVAGTGTIWMAIFLHQGPPAEGVDYSTPHPVVAVELDEQPGLRVSGTVEGARNAAIVIGRRVTLDWIERSGTPLPVWRLADASE